MERIFIKFGSEADLNYFLSVDADHFWLCRYHHIRLNNITLELDADFCELLLIEENRKILFSRRVIMESSKNLFIYRLIQILKYMKIDRMIVYMCNK